jgi:hypothetical protein
MLGNIISSTWWLGICFRWCLWSPPREECIHPRRTHLWVGNVLFVPAEMETNERERERERESVCVFCLRSLCRMFMLVIILLVMHVTLSFVSSILVQSCHQVLEEIDISSISRFSCRIINALQSSPCQHFLTWIMIAVFVYCLGCCFLNSRLVLASVQDTFTSYIGLLYSP